MNKKKVFFGLLFLIVTLFNVFELADMKSFELSLSKVLQNANAQIEEVIVTPNKGHEDERLCHYWQKSGTFEISFSVTDPSISLGGSWTYIRGVVRVCDYLNDNYCDYLACH